MAYYGGYGFTGMIQTLDQWGLLDVILPFILVFTLVFAVFEKTEILSSVKEQNKKYSAVIAMVMAFGVVIPHVTGSYYYGFDAVTIINNALPQVSLLLVAILMMLLTLGLWTGKKANGSKGVGKYFTLASGAIVVLIFLGSMGFMNVPSWVYMILNSDITPLAVAILVFGMIIKFITGSGKPAYKDRGAYDDAKKARRKERNNAFADFLADSNSNPSSPSKKD